MAISAKASYFRDPLLKVMHQIISHTVAGRKDSDLRWLYHIYEGANFNLAALMAEYFMNSGGKTPQSEIWGGEYVTVLAKKLGLLTPTVIEDLTMVTQGNDVDVRCLRYMHMITDTADGERLHDRQGEIWDPTPALPDSPEHQHL